MEEHEPKAGSDTGRKRGTVIFRIAVVLLLCAIIVLQLTQRCSRQEGEESPALGAIKARLGQLEGKTAEEIQAELNRVIEDGMFHITINTDPVFANGRAEGTLEIENVPNNHYSMRVAIYLDDTGELIYDSGLIEPNYHIQRDTLLEELEAGEYPATAVFYAYETDTLAEVGDVSSKLTIHVLH